MFVAIESLRKDIRVPDNIHLGVVQLPYEEYLDKVTSRLPNPDLNYYAITLSEDREGPFLFSVYSHYVGWCNDSQRAEIRQASVVIAEIVVEGWREAGEKCFVCDSPEDLEIYLFSGGHAVIEENVAKSGLAEFLEPEHVIQDGLVGYSALRDLPSNYDRRAPTKKLRMQVFKRDKWRCCICGRRPIDNTDVELHTHHIRPWADGGVTIDRNLITLCQTCHGGLSPHYERALHRMVITEQPGWSAAHLAQRHDFAIRYNANTFTRLFKPDRIFDGSP